MNSLEIAQKLHIDANHLLEKYQILNTLGQYGEVFFTGSYYLNLMAWTDIDLYVKFTNHSDPIKIFANIVQKFITIPEVTRVKFEKNFQKVNPKLPKGLYHIYFGKWKTPWKIDIWQLEQDHELKKLLETSRDLKKRITRNKRNIILDIKQLILTKEGRTPSLSGHYLYQAVLYKNLETTEEIISYMKKFISNLPTHHL